MLVDRVATAHKLKSAATGGAAETLADAWNGGTGFTGTIQLGLAGGTTADIDVDGSMDLYDLAAVINAQSQTTKVGAQVLKVNDAEYRLVLTGTETGKAVQISDVAGSVSGLLGLTDVQAAQTASFSIDGVALERTSNRIDDVLPGVTFELYKAEPATTVTVSVERSLGTVKTAITDFAAAYNAVRDFISANSSLNAVGEVDEAAVLHGERILRSLSAMLGSEAGRGVAGLASGAPMTLRDLGLTLDASNRLVVDQSKLDQKLLTEFDGVRDVLEFGFSPSSADLRVLSRTNALADTSFLVDIVDADADGIAESVTFDGVAGTVTNGVLEGAAGTAYEGLRMLWAGTGSTSIDVGATQGVADRFYNALDNILNEVDGELQRSVDQYGEANARYRTDIERIEARAEAERDRMIEKMARMEEALARTDALMQQIRAQMDAMNAKQD
jgi:flagellar hook-associated protein 2